MFNLHKDLVINSFADYPVTVVTAANAPIADLSATAAVAGSKLMVRGFGNFNFNDQRTVQGARGTASQNRIDNLTVANITFTAPSIPTVVTFTIKAKTDNYQATYSRYELNLGEDITYAITVLPTDTATTFAAKLLEQAAYRQNRFQDEVAVGITLGGGTAAAPTSLNFTGIDEHISWTYKIEDEFYVTSAVVTAIAPTISQIRYRSSTDGVFVEENVRVLTYESTRPYGIKQDQLAVRSALYDVYTFSQVVDRTEYIQSSVVGGTAQSKSEFTIYVNSALRGSQQLVNLVYFLDQSVTANGGTPAYINSTITDPSGNGEGQTSTAMTLAAIVA